jgi:hypothetical protein
LILSPSVINIIIKSHCNNKTPLTNKLFGPFRFIKPRFQSINN